MAKAMKKAAAEPTPAMKKGMRRAMKAMKLVNTLAKNPAAAPKAIATLAPGQPRYTSRDPTPPIFPPEVR